jgi:hypothetical protein
MSFFIAHVSGHAGATRASSRKRASLDADAFATYEEAEAVATGRWPAGAYFIIEAPDAREAEAQAIAESVDLDELSL